MLPLLCIFQRGFAALTLIVFQFGQDQGQFGIRQEHGLAVLGVNTGNRLAPVPLTGKNPLTEVVIGLSSCNTGLLQLDGDGLLGLFHSQSGEFLGVNELATLA